MLEKKLGCEPPYIIFIVGERGDARRRNVTVLAVVKAHNGYVARDRNAVLCKVRCNTGRDFIIPSLVEE